MEKLLCNVFELLFASVVNTHKADFKKYYLRKLAESKAKKLVLNNVANKLIKYPAPC